MIKYFHELFNFTRAELIIIIFLTIFKYLESNTNHLSYEKIQRQNGEVGVSKEDFNNIPNLASIIDSLNEVFSKVSTAPTSGPETRLIPKYRSSVLTGLPY